MRLTVYTDYSLRVLMYAALRTDRLATISEVAARFGISRNHIMKVVYQLARAGYIETVRGQNGGLRLARRAQDIRLGEIVRRTEPDMALVPCFEPLEAACVITHACNLRRVLQRARAAFLAVLDECTLADLTENHTVLSDLLAGVPPPSSTPKARPVVRRRATETSGRSVR